MRPCLTNALREREYIGEADASAHGTFAGPLDHGAIGQRIAEGHTELEHVAAIVERGESDVVGGFKGWVARSEIDDQAGLTRKANGHLLSKVSLLAHIKKAGTKRIVHITAKTSDLRNTEKYTDLY